MSDNKAAIRQVAISSIIGATIEWYDPYPICRTQVS